MIITRRFIKSITDLSTLMTLSIMLFLGGQNEANASCNYISGSAQTLNITPAASVSIPRDAVNGTVIYTSETTSAQNVIYSCTGDLAGVKSLIGNQPTGVSANSIFPIGTTGLGFRWKTNIVWGFVPPYGWRTEGTSNRYTFGPSNTFAFQLLKIGPITAGAEVPAGSVAQYSVGSILPLTLALTQKIVVTQLTCTTPDVTVSMGTQKTSGFSGINTRQTPVAFAIKLNACPTGINSVKYRLDPITDIINKTASVVALSADSTATGVGVQILDNSDKAYPLGIDTVFSSYAAAGGNFSIPLKAAYYQTGNTARGGTANTSFTFTMTYQ